MVAAVNRVTDLSPPPNSNARSLIYIDVTVNLHNQSFRVMTDMFRHYAK